MLTTALDAQQHEYLMPRFSASSAVHTVKSSRHILYKGPGVRFGLSNSRPILVVDLSPLKQRLQFGPRSISPELLHACAIELLKYAAAPTNCHKDFEAQNWKVCSTIGLVQRQNWQLMLPWDQPVQIIMQGVDYYHIQLTNVELSG
jgi:hypothetical protein